ncbi:MAG: hypothetical protein ABI873_11835 [Marmoricola sp.]
MRTGINHVPRHNSHGASRFDVGLPEVIVIVVVIALVAVAMLRSRR